MTDLTPRGQQLGYLIPQFPGQTHIFFWREIEALKARGIDTHLFSTRRPLPRLVSHDWSSEVIAQTTYLHPPDASAIAVGLAKLPMRDWSRACRGEPRQMLRDMLVSLPAAAMLLRHARRHRITHVHVHSCGRAALIAALARRMGGPTYSLTLHGPLEDYGPGQRYKWRYAEFATIITEKLQAEITHSLAGALPPILAVQAMGVDTDQLSRHQPWSAPNPDGPVHVFACGRLNPIKGHEDLIEAVRLLRDSGRDVRLAIAGEDDDGGTGYRKTLEGRIAALGMGQSVTLLGAISDAEVQRHLLAAHYFALASWHEPLGVALMEAMSCELPTIGTAAGGVSELITDGKDGLMVPPRSPKAMAAAIAGLIADPERARKLGRAGRARIVDRFASARGADTLIRLVAESRQRRRPQG